jgi:DHA2 family multidrug resistance protein
MQHNFMAAGKGSNEALKTAYAAMDGMVTKQSAVLSYMDVFYYLSVMFLICVPFVLMVKGSKQKKISMADAH